MAAYFLPTNPSSGESGQYNRRPVFFVFRTRPMTWTWGYGAGGLTSNFPPVRAIVYRDDPNTPFLVTDYIQPTTNAYPFTFDLPDGHYIVTFEGQFVEVLPKAFVVNSTGQQLPDEYAWTSGTRFERSGVGIPLVPAEKLIKVDYPGALPTPKIFPLKPRTPEKFSEYLRANKLWARHSQQNTGAGGLRRWVRVNDGSPKGALWIEPDQNYFGSEAFNKGLEPFVTLLRDGPRGVGTLGWLATMIPSPADAGWYWVDIVGRVGFMFHDGRVITIAGWRVKEGELKGSGEHISHTRPVSTQAEDKEFYARAWEFVGDWSRVPDPKRFHEPWDITGVGQGPDDGLHEFWIPDTLNDRILYIDHYTAHGPGNYHKAQWAPEGYEPPDAPTGQSTVVVFASGLNQPWGITHKMIDGDLWIYWSEFGGNVLKRKRAKGGDVEVVLDSMKKPSDAQLGVPIWPPYRLSTAGLTAAKRQSLRDLYVVDGPPGVATCVRPEQLRFDSQGRLTWVEGYVDVVRRIDHDGQVKTIGVLPGGTVAISLAIDTEGSFGPKDDIFTTAFWEANARFSTDGVKRGRVMEGIVSSQTTSGPAEWVRPPGYGWPIGIGHGRMVLQGNAGASQIVEYTKRQPEDPVIDVPRVRDFINNWWHRNTTLELTNGIEGQCELGTPRMEEIGSWDEETQRAFFSLHGVPDAQLANALYAVWALTLQYDYSETPPPPPPPPVDCVLSEWSEWSEWGPSPVDPDVEIRTRTREIVTMPSNGGAPCGPLEETETRPVVVPGPSKDEALAGLDTARRYIEGT